MKKKNICKSILNICIGRTVEWMTLFEIINRFKILIKILLVLPKGSSVICHTVTYTLYMYFIKLVIHIKAQS